MRQKIEGSEHESDNTEYIKSLSVKNINRVLRTQPDLSPTKYQDNPLHPAQKIPTVLTDHGDMYPRQTNLANVGRTHNEGANVKHKHILQSTKNTSSQSSLPRNLSSKAFRVKTEADDFGSTRNFFLIKTLEYDLDPEYRSSYRPREDDYQYKSSVTKNLMSINKMKKEYTDLMIKEDCYDKKDKKAIVFGKKAGPRGSITNPQDEETYNISSSVSPERDLPSMIGIGMPDVKVKKLNGFYHYHDGRVSRDSVSKTGPEPAFTPQGYIDNERFSQVSFCPEPKLE